MRAPLAALGDAFDLVVVGGGVHGAFAALDAARRGVRVALVEQRDFASGTSANSLRIAHGGLRDLARADWRRMRESIRERARLMQMAPHLVRPLPCALPLQGRARLPFVAAALRASDVLTKLHAHDGQLPPSRTFAGSELRELAGEEWWGVETRAAALWHDALIASPERLVIMALREAVEHGAVIRNYTEATALLRSAAGRVHGVAVRSDDGTAEVRARVVLDTTGRASAALTGRPSPSGWAIGWNLVTTRPAQRVAVGIPFPAEERMLFAVPWRGAMVLGTGYAPAGESADFSGPGLPVGGPLVELAASLVAAANRSRPGLALQLEDVALVQAGTLPMASHSARGVTLLDRPVIVQHEREGGPPGVISLFGVKWTTARAAAERAIDLCEDLVRGRRSAKRAVERPLCMREPGAAPGDDERLTALYGPLAPEVESLAREAREFADDLSGGFGAPLIGAQVAHAIRREGARHLTDVLLRRTDAGTAGWPGDAAVAGAARIMSAEAGWSDARAREERVEVERIFGRGP